MKRVQFVEYDMRCVGSQDRELRPTPRQPSDFEQEESSQLFPSPAVNPAEGRLHIDAVDKNPRIAAVRTPPLVFRLNEPVVFECGLRPDPANDAADPVRHAPILSGGRARW